MQIFFASSASAPSLSPTGRKSLNTHGKLKEFWSLDWFKMFVVGVLLSIFDWETCWKHMGLCKGLWIGLNCFLDNQDYWWEALMFHGTTFVIFCHILLMQLKQYSPYFVHVNSPTFCIYVLLSIENHISYFSRMCWSNLFCT